MKKLLLIPALFCSSLAFAGAPAPAAPAPAAEEWNDTTLSDALIAKVQTASHEYKTCAATEMQKPAYVNADVRKASEAVIKQCEPVLAKIRAAYLSEKVPAVIADRHLKQMRTQTIRGLLAELMFRDAARKAGQ